jgi:hypothetical protein
MTLLMETQPNDSLSELHKQVTQQIFDVEHTTAGSTDFDIRNGYTVLSQTEERIADHPGTEGIALAVARRGAIRAAMYSGDFKRVNELLLKYIH